MSNQKQFTQSPGKELYLIEMTNFKDKAKKEKENQFRFWFPIVISMLAFAISVYAALT